MLLSLLATEVHDLSSERNNMTFRGERSDMEHCSGLLRVLCAYFVIIDAVLAGCSGINGRCPSTCRCDRDNLLVDCRGRGLLVIPELPENTSTVILAENNITRIIPSDFSKCTTLHTIDLSNNLLRTVENDSLADLRELCHLFIEGNEIDLANTTYSLPIGIFDPLRSLTELRIHHNIWTQMMDYRIDLVRGKPALQHLSLDSPGGSVDIPTAFSQLFALQTLDIYGGMTRLGNNTLSALNSTTIEHLRIIGKNLAHIDVLAFSHLRHMTSMDLSNNRKLCFERHLYQAWYGLKYTRVQKLYLLNICAYYTAQSTPPIKVEFFNYLNETPLVELYLDDNGLSDINASFHKVLPSLQKLSLSYNSFFGYFRTLFTDLHHMQNLSYIDVSKQSTFPTLQASRHLDNGFLFVVFPPNLRVLNISSGLSVLQLHISTLVVFTRTKYMDVLDISQNSIWAISQGFDVNPAHIVHISYFNISSCGLFHLSFPPGHKLQFRGDTMDLTNNNLGGQYASDPHGASFSSVVTPFHAKEIFLTHNDIKELSPAFFVSTSGLERVHLNQNALRIWNCTLVHMPNITFLDLSDNLLASLPRERYREMDGIRKNQPLSLGLKGNPLICDCYTLDFLTWLYTTNVTIIEKETYRCVMNNTLISMKNLKGILDKLNIECKIKIWLKVIGVMLGILILSMCLSVVMYRHRWDIKYTCLLIVRRRRLEQILSEQNRFEYDAFVAYHNEDQTWVTHGLMIRLETGPKPLRLCIHHRDWLPGPTIEENISRSVEVSRQTVVVLSKHFMQSGWCELELQLARMRGLDEGREIIIVVALEHIPMREMSSTLQNLRRMNTWLDWYEYENDREQFWELLEEALAHPRFRNNRLQQMRVTANHGNDEDRELLLN